MPKGNSGAICFNWNLIAAVFVEMWIEGHANLLNWIKTMVLNTHPEKMNYPAPPLFHL